MRFYIIQQVLATFYHFRIGVFCLLSRLYRRAQILCSVGISIAIKTQQPPIVTSQIVLWLERNCYVVVTIRCLGVPSHRIYTSTSHISTHVAWVQPDRCAIRGDRLFTIMPMIKNAEIKPRYRLPSIVSNSPHNGTDSRAACETPGAGGLAQSSILLVNTHSPWIADWMPAPEDRRHAER